MDDPIDFVNKRVPGNKNVQEQYPSAVELMAELDSQSQQLHTQLAEALEQLKKSEKRLPHEIDLLKNDVSAFHGNQNEKLQQISEMAQSTRHNQVFTELAELEEMKQRIESVRDLLIDAQNKTVPETEERKAQFAAMFADTVEGQNYKQEGYTGFINKIIK